MNVAIITARGGSKRIPRKNLRDFCGRPILAYSIDAAKNARCFDEVMVSTDDPEIAAFAIEQGAAVPFMRSPEASSDTATTAAAVTEVLADYGEQGRTFDYACCIYPTAPFVTPETLTQGLAILQSDAGLSGVVPVVPFSFPIQRAFRVENGRVLWCDRQHRLTRSQDLEPTFHDAGQFYWLRVAAFTSQPELVGDATAALILPEWQVHDIDNEDDWILAELKYKFARSRRA